MATCQTHYQKSIAQYLAKRKIENVDPRHIEGFMRLQYSTLSHLDSRTFNAEIRLGVACIAEGGVENAEANAVSFGL